MKNDPVVATIPHTAIVQGTHGGEIEADCTVTVHESDLPSYYIDALDLCRVLAGQACVHLHLTSGRYWCKTCEEYGQPDGSACVREEARRITAQADARGEEA